VDPDMTSTTFTLAGHRIVESLGVVRGVTVRSRSLFGTIGAKIETLFGRQGANAVVGVRYDATEIMSGVTEVLCADRNAEDSVS